eukprot:2839764-Alexandrium_andersonii.AAC.1
MVRYALGCGSADVLSSPDSPERRWGDKGGGSSEVRRFPVAVTLAASRRRRARGTSLTASARCMRAGEGQ